MPTESLHQIVRRAESNLTSGTTKIGKYVNFSMHETLETITAYLNSKHTASAKDSLGRDKPFFNIVTAARNIWWRATDIDRANIRFTDTKLANTALVFIANVLLQNWMNKNNFGMFLNQWGLTLSGYGSAVVEFVEKGDDLVASVIQWNRVICDPVDFHSLPKIKKIYKAPAKLLDMATKGHPDYVGYNLDVVKGLLDSRMSRENLDSNQIDNIAEFIELYEIRGELSMATYNEAKNLEVTEKDKETYKQQLHVLSFLQSKSGEFKDFTLFSGFETKDPQMITHLIEEDGRTLGIGSVEYLFDAQWMENHTIKQWKDQMDISSMLIWQTSDSNLQGKNSLLNMVTGDFVIHKDGSPVERFPNEGHDISNLQAFAGQWKALAQELTSTPDALRGNTLPSGTPFALGNLLTQNASSLFEIMTENKGLYIEEMMKRYFVPWMKKKLKNKDEIVAILDDAGIKEIDAMYIPSEAARRFNNHVKEKVLSGDISSLAPFDKVTEEASVQQGLSTLGNKRFFKPDDLDQKQWDEVFSDFNWESIKVEVTNEAFDKSAALSTLSTVLQTIASNPLILQDPNAKMVFNQILSTTGLISPMQLTSTQPPPPPVQPTANPQPQPNPVGAGQPLPVK